MSQSRPDPLASGPPAEADLPTAVSGARDERRDGPDGSADDGDDAPPRGPTGDGTRWAEALLEAEEPILQMIGSGHPLGETLDALGRMIEALCDGASCAVLLLDSDGRTLRCVAAPSLPQSYRDAVRSVPVGPGGDSCGTAAFTGEPVVCADIAADPAWAGRAHLPLAHGLRACLSMPFRAATGEVLGTMGAFFRQPRRPTDREVCVARRAARLAAIAVERHAAEDRYRRIVETANEGIWQLDAEQRTAFVNARMAEMLGYAPAEMLGRPVWDFVFEEDRPEGRRGWERKAQGVRETAEYRLRRKDGSSLWAHGSTSPVHDGEGRFVGALGMFADITGRKRAEEKLRASEEHSRAVYDQAAVGIAEVDLSGRFTRANDRYCEIVGYPREELLRLRFQDITHPDDPPAHREQFARIAEGPSSYTIEKRYIRKDGREVWVRAAVSQVRDGSGGPTSVVAVVEDITERVRLEAELQRRLEELAAVDRRKGELLASLREGEERFRGLMEQAPFSIQVFSPDGRTLRVNRAWEELWGVTLDKIPDYNILRDQQLEAKGVLPSIRRAFAGEPAAIPAIQYDPNETLPDRTSHRDPRRWVSAVAYPLKDAAGRVREVVLVHEDITERKRAEEALRESEERFRQLAGAMPQIVWIAGPDHAVEFYNERWFEYTGLTPEESYRPEGWRAAVHPDDIARILEAGAISRGAAAPFEAEYRLRDRHGRYRWHLGRAVPVFDSRGNVVRRLGTATDIDDRRRAEQDARFLAEAGAALAALTDEAGALRQVARLAVPHFADWCAVDLLGDDGSLRRLAVAHADPAKVELGYDLHRRYPTRPDTPQGVHEVIRTGVPALVPEITDELLATGARDEEHLRILRELGLRSYLCVPLGGREGPMGAIAFIAAESGRRYGPDDLRLAEDLARRAAIAVENARLYDALREADRRKDEFLATLAHELRNPLAPIRTALHLMAHPDPDGRGHQAERAMAERQVVHLSRLVDDLMDVARISRGKIELKRQVVELGPILSHAVEAVRSALADRGHALVVEPPSDPILLEADPTRLEQVLDNLLTNAIKYTEPGGRIVLSAGRDGGEAVIRVSDTGIGIPPEMLPRVFEMFAQVDDRSTRTQGGLGIGLGLVKNLVEMHGGTIAAQSAGPGAGSAFVVRLPALPASAPETAEPRRGQRDGGRSVLPRRRLLVVDDNVDAANSLARVLQRLYRQDVRVAHDGPEALAAAEEFRPEVILLDIGMPGMDGYEVARRLREEPGLDGALLVALTGWGQESDRRKAREAGFDRHLVKPVDPESIRELLAATR